MLLASTVIALVFLVKPLSDRLPKYLIIGASFGFYALWNPGDIPVLLLSLFANFIFFLLITQSTGRLKTGWLVLGISFNALLLLWFKVGGNIPMLATTPENAEDHGLPLGISFFTFQQIAYLVSASRSEQRVKVEDYVFVITFFPHLIAGPLVQHKNVIQQLNLPSMFSFNPVNMFAGFTLFVIGLSKKVLIADPLGLYSNAIFAGADAAVQPDMLTAWIGAVAGFLNFYFDFSGYSDMACGLALVLGLRLPLNFYSPFKAVSMDDFWNRWNITVTSFFRQHVFRPLAGKRLSIPRHLAALPVTMLIAGAWHGATFNFLVWGALHGLIVTAQHAKRLYFRTPAVRRQSSAQRVTGWAQTQLLLIILGCVFQAQSLDGSWRMVKGLFGFGNGQSMEIPSILSKNLVDALSQWDMLNFLGSLHGNWSIAMAIAFVAGAWSITLLAPNSIQLLRRYRPVTDPTNLFRKGAAADIHDYKSGSVKPDARYTIFIGGLLALCLLKILSNAPSTFNYYNY